MKALCRQRIPECSCMSREAGDKYTLGTSRNDHAIYETNAEAEQLSQLS